METHNILTGNKLIKLTKRRKNLTRKQTHKTHKLISVRSQEILTRKQTHKTHRQFDQDKLIKLIRRVPERETHELLKAVVARNSGFLAAVKRSDAPYEFYEFVSNATCEIKIVQDLEIYVHIRGCGETHRTHKLIGEDPSMSPGAGPLLHSAPHPHLRRISFTVPTGPHRHVTDVTFARPRRHPGGGP